MHEWWAVFELLAPLLRVADVARLRRALGREYALGDQRVWAAAAELLRLRLKVRGARISDVFASVANASTRCIECGARSRCRARVCLSCSADATARVCMVTRAYVRSRIDELGGWHQKRALRRRLPELRVVKRARSGAVMSGKLEVDALVAFAAAVPRPPPASRKGKE
jgi:hypothetical protein